MSGQPFAAAVRELVDSTWFGLDSTWWEDLEPPPEGAPERAHQYIDETDTFAFDPSFDLYGGGGLVATLGDAAAFFGALESGLIGPGHPRADALHHRRSETQTRRR